MAKIEELSSGDKVFYDYNDSLREKPVTVVLPGDIGKGSWPDFQFSSLNRNFHGNTIFLLDVSGHGGFAPYWLASACDVELIEKVINYSSSVGPCPKCNSMDTEFVRLSNKCKTCWETW